jgi:Helix-turn-helix domain
MSKREMEDYEREGMIDFLRCNRPEPTQFIPPNRGQKQLSCYAVGALRRKGVSKEQAASVIAVLIWLIKHANPTNGRCDPSVAKLAFETGLGERSVRRAIKVAEDVGYLAVETRTGCTSAYHLDFDAMTADFHEIEEQAKNPPRSCMTGHPGQPGPVTPVIADLLKHKEENVEEKTYPKGVHPPLAAATIDSFLNEKEGIQGERLSNSTPQTLTSANPSEAEAYTAVSGYCTASDWDLLTEVDFEEAVAAEIANPGSGLAVVKAAAKKASRAKLRKEMGE